ncbi:phosphatidylinositol N-acetylglucosaminyltransferase subunit P-like [Galendromus occidentalis]|uniref:Phosphatidylinositol N-acetylglucosaminyltransferase subunit P-like n=1 Tax=Galendromus occidentalis TaxID=34638 RepID=A0AAJ6W0F5_9ACAR|nr:phosphatidylinositol N-acetylglucosaminyltransferase subunit P-like [Galendromus occidentalis]
MIGAQITFIAYLAWAYIPSRSWASIGITYLPDKYWAIALPSWLIVSVLTFACCIYPGYILSCSPTNTNLIEDSVTSYDVVKHFDGVDIEPLRDIPISKINQTLYRKRE